MGDLKGSCKHYNWGGTGAHPSYPSEMGARCEFKNKFFDSREECEGCAAYEEKPESLPQREQSFLLPYKVGMINLWRRRCTEHNIKCGKKVNPEDCKTCDAVAKEIVADIKECTMTRAFKEKP